MGIRLMIIELEKYNSAEELHIETRTTGHRTRMLSEWDRRVSVTRRCLHGVGRNRMRTGTGCIQMGLSWNEHRDAGDDCGAIKKY